MWGEDCREVEDVSRTPWEPSGPSGEDRYIDVQKAAVRELGVGLEDLTH